MLNCGSSCCGAAETDLTSIHEDEGIAQYLTNFLIQKEYH